MITVNTSVDKTEAYKIAESLPDYFNEGGLKAIQEALEVELVYGAYQEEQLVGFATFKKLNEDAIELSFIGVLPELQGQNIGSTLVAVALEELQARYRICEVKTLADTVDDANYARTRNFWKKQGFVQIEIIDPYPGWDLGNPCVILVKSLR